VLNLFLFFIQPMIQAKRNSTLEVALPRELSFFEDDELLSSITGEVGIVLTKIVGHKKSILVQQEDLYIHYYCERPYMIFFEIGDLPSGEYTLKILFKNHYKYVTICNIQ
jgi:hypothetical protein